MDRLINRRQQGDLGEASAIEWLTRQGATVFTPLGHSPDVDLVADFGSLMLRVQVKTTTHFRGKTFSAMIATNGGNQSWTGMTKYFDASRCDALFVLAGDGRRWFIPSREVEARRAISLGGDKYAEFEIESGLPISDLVYGPDRTSVESDLARGSFGVGEPSDTVNVVAMPEWVRIPPPPSPTGSDIAVGRTRVSSNHQVTLPKAPFASAGLAVGDLIRVEALDDGSLRMTRINRPTAS